MPETGKTPSQVSRDCRCNSRQVVGTYSDGTESIQTIVMTTIEPLLNKEFYYFCTSFFCL